MIKLNNHQLGELAARDFLEDGFWKAYKQDYDACMSFRKTIKGKPTDAERALLALNNTFIEFYSSILFHSAALDSHKKCACLRCTQKKGREAAPAL